MAFVINGIKWLLWTVETMYFDVVVPVFLQQKIVFKLNQLGNSFNIFTPSDVRNIMCPVNTSCGSGSAYCWRRVLANTGWQSTRTHVNSPHVNSYPCQFVPMSTHTTDRCQLVPQVMSTCTTSVNSYPARQVTDDGTSWHLLSHNRCQLVPMSTRTHVNSYQR